MSRRFDANIILDFVRARLSPPIEGRTIMPSRFLFVSFQAAGYGLQQASTNQAS